MKWIVQEDFTSEHTDTLFSKAVKDLGSDIHVVQYRPFVGPKDIRNGLGEITCPVLFYGCIKFISKIQQIDDYKPGAYSNFSALCCKSYYPILGNLLLNYDYVIVPWKKLTTNWFDGVRFIRPDNGRKTFLGMVTDFDHILEDVGSSVVNIQDGTLALVTSVKRTKFEWRFFVSNEGKVITGCQYHKNGELDVEEGYDNQAYVLAEKVCNIQKLNERIKDLVYVVDVCLTDGNEYKVVELNSFSCAGVYACDVKKLVAYIKSKLCNPLVV